MRKLLKTSLISFTSLFFAIPALAGESPSKVVELFTSQGCSSCPPANEYVGSLIDDDDKLVLSYGVTYWDYLGWTDTFGDPKYTKRQKAYGAALDIGFVYTPQIVLNGRDHNSRYTNKDIRESAPLEKAEISIDVFEVDGRLAVRSNAKRIHVVTFQPGWQKVAVRKGENGGRTLKLGNVVEDLQLIKKSGRTDIEITPGKAYAALVHDEKTLEIIAASVLKTVPPK